MRRNTFIGLVLLVLVALGAWFADRHHDDRRDSRQAPPMTAPAPVPVAARILEKKN